MHNVLSGFFFPYVDLGARISDACVANAEGALCSRSSVFRSGWLSWAVLVSQAGHRLLWRRWGLSGGCGNWLHTSVQWQGENRSWVSASVGLSQLPVPTGFLCPALGCTRIYLETVVPGMALWAWLCGGAHHCLPSTLECWLCRSNSYSVPFQRLLLCPALILAVPAGQEGPFTPRVLRFCSVASQQGLVMTAVSSLTWASMNFCAGGRRGLGS